MKKSLFARLLIVILCLSLVLCGCKKSDGESKGEKGGENNAASLPDTPEEIAATSLGRTLSAIFGGEGDLGILNGEPDCCKLTVSVAEYVENVMYIDANKLNIVDELSLNMDGVEIDAAIYLDKTDLVVALPGLVDGAYGVNLKTLAKDLENSELLAMLGIDIDDLKNELGIAMDEMAELMEQMDSYTDGMEEALESALSNIDKTVVEGTATVDDQEVDAIIVTYSLDTEGLLNMIEELGAGVADYLEKLSSTMGEDMEVGDISGELDAMMGELESTLADADLNAELVVNINAETGYIMTVEGEFKGTVEGENGGVTLDIDFGVNAAESDKYTLNIGTISDDEEMDVLQIILNRDITDAEVNYELSLKAAGVEVGSAALNYDKKSGAYELSLEADGAQFSANGIYKLTAKSLELSVDSINVDGDKTDINVKILLEQISANRIPKTPNYKNILKLSQEEFVKLANELSEKLNQFYYEESEPTFDYEDWSEFEDGDEFEDWYEYEI